MAAEFQYFQDLFYLLNSPIDMHHQPSRIDVDVAALKRSLLETGGSLTSSSTVATAKTRPSPSFKSKQQAAAAAVLIRPPLIPFEMVEDDGKVSKFQRNE